MSEGAGVLGVQEQLSRLGRQGSQAIQDEQSLVTATGTAPAGWTVKVVSLDEYNVYNVEQVQITTAGSLPALVGGSATTAFNVAEAFDSDGNVSAGTYAVMWRVGGVNVFYVEP